MNAQRLLEYFARIEDASDESQRMRRLILDLALRGKLLPQKPADEPASELLNPISAEKARLKKAGLITQERTLPVIGDGERLFELPRGWSWTRLGNIASYIQRGKSRPKYAVSDGFPVISQKCVQWRGLDLSAAKMVTRESLANYEENRFLRDGDLLWNSIGTGTIGRVVRVVSPPPKIVCDSHVTLIRCLYVNPEYVRVWLRSDHVYASIEDRAAGSTNQIKLSAEMAVNQIVPLPPLAEQCRIVVKVDELMALCDQLEVARAEGETVRDKLAAASLARLNAPDPDPATFADDFRFALNNLAALTTSPEQIRHLRQTILNLATRGRLVPQDPRDEPASELLKRLAAEAESYAEQNCMSPAKPDAVAKERVPYLEPIGWQWSRLGSLFNVITDGDHHPPPKSDKGVAFLTIGNVTTGKLNFTGCRFVSPSYFTSLASYRTPRKGDILYTVVGATCGRPALVETDQAFCVQRHIAILKPASELSPRFLMYLLSSPPVYEQATRSTTGSAQPTIALRLLRNLLVPLPPLAEQHRTSPRLMN